MAELRARELETHRNEFRKRRGLIQEQAFLREQLALVQQVLDFKQMQFDRGKLDFDALVRAQMDLIGMRMRIARLDAEITGLAGEEGQYQSGGEPMTPTE